MTAPTAADDTLFRVKSSSNVNSLGAAIAHALDDTGRPVTLRMIGAGAVNQGVKASCVAQSYQASQGVNLTYRLGLVKVELDDGDEVTAVALRVIPE